MEAKREKAHIFPYLFLVERKTFNFMLENIFFLNVESIEGNCLGAVNYFSFSLSAEKAHTTSFKKKRKEKK